MKDSNTAILNIKASDYCCIVSLISKNEVINLMQNSYLTKKSRTVPLKNIDIEKVKVSNKICFSEKKNQKYFIGYLYNDHKVRPIHIMLPKTSAHERVMMNKMDVFFD